MDTDDVGGVKRAAPVGSAPCSALCRVVAEAAPFAERLVALLAPWDRARLRLTCRALAAAVPARSFAATLAGMVRAGGAELLRYGAGDARPFPAHLLLAVAHDAADALRWLLPRDDGFAVGPERVRAFRRLALRTGSAAVLDVVRAPAPVSELAHAVEELYDACLGGRELLAAERAAAVVAVLVSRSAYAALGREHRVPLGTVLRWAVDKNMHAVLDPFLDLVGAHGDAVPDAFATDVRCAALATGRRQAVEPCDWGRVAPHRLLRSALYGGELDLAAEAWSRLRQWHGDLLCETACVRRNAHAALDRALGHTVGPVSHHRIACIVARAVRHDAADTLRWLSERAWHVPDANLLVVACNMDAVGCAAYIMDCGVRPTAAMLAHALLQGQHRVAGAIGSRVTCPVDLSDLKRLLGQVFVNWQNGLGVRSLALLRRLALLPAPDVPFLRALLDMEEAHQLPMLAAAGYWVDADRRTWLDAVAPHCAGTSPDEWRPLADELYDRCHARYGALPFFPGMRVELSC